MCGLMHTLAPSTTLTNGIGSTANLQACHHTHLSIENFTRTVMNYVYDWSMPALYAVIILSVRFTVRPSGLGVI